MNNKERISQCKKDIKVLQKELKKLEQEQDHINKYLEEHPFRYGSVIRKETYVKVPLPVANDAWTWEAFEWARNFCAATKKLGYYSYPRHDKDFDWKYLYIKV